jgi:hypothetical protein
VSFRREYCFHFPRNFRPFHRNAPENALDPAVSDRTYLTWDSVKNDRTYCFNCRHFRSYNWKWFTET